MVFGILFQCHLGPQHPDGKGILHLVTFLSEKISPAECNYENANKELLAIVVCQYKWHMYLYAVSCTIYIDHTNLQQFATKSWLNWRQAQWTSLLAQYWYEIVFRPVKANRKADVLPCWSGDLPKKGGNRNKHRDSWSRPFQVVLDPIFFSPSWWTLNATTTLIHSGLCYVIIKHNTGIRAALTFDKFAFEILTTLENGTKHHHMVLLEECTMDNNFGLLYVYRLLYVSNNLALQSEIIHAQYDHPTARHPWRAATSKLVSRNYWWSGIWKTAPRYLKNCYTFLWIKLA